MVGLFEECSICEAPTGCSFRGGANVSAMRQDWVAYLLAACSVFGFAGLQRFYLRRPVTGVLYLVTWGFFGVGTLYDLIWMRKLVRQANAQLLGPVELGLLDPAAASPEQRAAQREHSILQCARAHGGTITTALVALEVKIPLEDAQKALHRLRTAGFCTLDVSEDGAELFTFHGLGSTRPMSL